jgi:cytochrome P450
MSTDIADDQRISEDDILNQISTFLFAGSDTSSLTLTWTLYLLAKHPEVQTRLRTELQNVRAKLTDSWIVVDEGTTANSAALVSALDALPLLDCVLRESLRLIPPVHSSIRVATEDDEIPLSEPVTMKDGTKRSSVRIKRGQFVHVAVEGFNLDRSAWGENGWEFEYARFKLSTHPPEG